MDIYTYSEEETFNIGFSLAKKARAGEIYTLCGELGAGKTVLAKGFGKGLGIDRPITSPTFNIIKEYDEGTIPLYHFDVYRISDISEMYELGVREYFYGEGVCLIEWASLISELIPEDAIRINITRENEPNKRHIIIDGKEVELG